VRKLLSVLESRDIQRAVIAIPPPLPYHSNEKNSLIQGLRTMLLEDKDIDRK